MADPVQLGQQYAQQMHQVADQAQQEVLNLPARIQRKIEDTIRMVKMALTDFTGGVEAGMLNFLMKSYMWSSVCLFGYLAAQWIGKCAFYAVLQAFLGSWTSLAIFAVFGPLLVWGGSVHFAGGAAESDQMVFVASFLLGLLDGTSMTRSRMAFLAPPAPLLSLSIGTHASTIGALDLIRNDRRIFVPAVISPAVAVCTIGGLMQAVPSYFTYLSVLILATVIDLQTKIHLANQGSLGSMPLEQWKTVIIMSTADTFAVRLLADTPK